METVSAAVEAFLKPGSGYGSGSGSGYGDGDGSGSGSGYGYGDGDGYGDGVKKFCGQTVHRVDGLHTLIDRVHDTVAKVRILNKDLTVTPGYVAKGGGYFAHGETLQDAMAALEIKIMDNMPVEEKIGLFMEKFKPGQAYPVREFYDWHNRLTGSCEAGRRSFARDHEIDIEKDEMTPEQFMALTKDAYGGSVIRELMEAWANR